MFLGLFKKKPQQSGREEDNSAASLAGNTEHGEMNGSKLLGEQTGKDFRDEIEDNKEREDIKKRGVGFLRKNNRTTSKKNKRSSGYLRMGMHKRTGDQDN